MGKSFEAKPTRLGPGESEMKMKKLMIAAAAALCATVGFGEVQSDNIVG